MRIFILCLLLVTAIQSQAQTITNTIWGYLGDFSLNTTPGSVTISTLINGARTVNGVLISPNYPPVNIGTNGVFAITNLQATGYRAVFDSGLTFPFYVATNTLGSNNIANLGTFTSASPPPYIVLNSSAFSFVTLTNGPGIGFVGLSTNVINGLTNILIQVRTN